MAFPAERRRSRVSKYDQVTRFGEMVGGTRTEAIGHARHHQYVVWGPEISERGFQRSGFAIQRGYQFLEH